VIHGLPHAGLHYPARLTGWLETDNSYFLTKKYCRFFGQLIFPVIFATRIKKYAAVKKGE
jgi:hypothetical protein